MNKNISGTLGTNMPGRTPPAAGVVTLVYDTFTAPDGTDLHNRLPEITVGGALWKGVYGQAQPNAINGGRVNAGWGASQAAVYCGSADGVVMATITIGNLNYHGFLLRMKEFNGVGPYANAGWKVYVGSPVGAPSCIRIYEDQQDLGGPITLRTEVLMPEGSELVVGQAYPCRVDLNGPTITVTVNGVTASYNEATFQQTETYHGIIRYPVGDISDGIDNFKLTEL